MIRLICGDLCVLHFKQKFVKANLFYFLYDNYAPARTVVSQLLKSPIIIITSMLKHPLTHLLPTTEPPPSNLNESIIQCVSKKRFPLFFKSPQLNFAKYFREIFIPMDSFVSLLSDEIKYFDGISFLGEQKILLWKVAKSSLDKILVLACISKVECWERLRNCHKLF